MWLLLAIIGGTAVACSTNAELASADAGGSPETTPDASPPDASEPSAADSGEQGEPLDSSSTSGDSAIDAAVDPGPDSAAPFDCSGVESLGKDEGVEVIQVPATLETEPTSLDADDPAIWVHPNDASQSLILGTNKVGAPDGALVVYDLTGKTQQTLDGIDRPNNVDVQDGFELAGKQISIAVLTENRASRLRVYAIDETSRQVSEISAPTGLEVFAGREGDAAAPMGISLYRRPSDGTVYAIVSPKQGEKTDHLWQYKLESTGGKVTASKVREFGAFSGEGEIEAIVVDDESGYVYYADELSGIRKWHADPDHPDAATQLAHFGREGYQGDREGLALYALPNGSGYIVSTDQLDGNSRYRLFPREGTADDLHQHDPALKVVAGGADRTDGLEVTSAPLGPEFPNGLMVAMNDVGKNFFVFDWNAVARCGSPKLQYAPQP